MTAAPSSDVAPTPARVGRPGRTATRARPGPAARRFGYLLAIAANVAFWLVLHRWPGWQEAPFLTDATTRVLPWVDAQIGLAVAVNALWLMVDPRWVRVLGELVTAVAGVVVTLRVLDVFPFAFDDGTPWEALARVVLWVAVVGSVVAVLVNLVALVRAPTRPVPGSP